jgi:hypothetical protein
MAVFPKDPMQTPEEKALRDQRDYVKSEILTYEMAIKRCEYDIVKFQEKLEIFKGISAILEEAHYEQLDKNLKIKNDFIKNFFKEVEKITNG